MKFTSIFHNFCNTIIGIILSFIGGIGMFVSKSITMALIPIVVILSGLFMISLDWEGRHGNG